MFSGIVEQLASVVAIAKPPGKKTTKIKVKLGKLAEGLKEGESVCVNGVCLTVTTKRKGVVSFDVIEETLRVTNLGDLTKGSKVNIERGLILGDRIDGHLVTGHVDGTGSIARTEKQADGSTKLWITTGMNLLSLMVPKGSVAVDGISLTVVNVSEDSFSVCLIPRTLSVTTFSYKTLGDFVNIELDMIGKYVQKWLEQTKFTAPSQRVNAGTASTKPRMPP